MSAVEYRLACERVRAGDWNRARVAYEELREAVDPELRALVSNDLGVLDVLEGSLETASRAFVRALAIDAGCEPARANLGLIVEDSERGQGVRSTRVAIVSFLFNWPSTGGGIVHTVELTRFLGRAGYDVRLICPRFEPWGIGRVDDGCPAAVTVVPFEESDWRLPEITSRLRAAVGDFDPDGVVVTDAWNVKPHLVHAFRAWPVHVRMQAQECLCPLNNLRLLPGPDGPSQCPRHQLATPDECRSCLVRNGTTSGELHRRERSLSGVGSEAYTDRLRTSFAEAESVLALNPLVAETLRPWCRRVEVVTWGMDTERFPDVVEPSNDDVVRLLFAGLAAEPIKGYSVLREACDRLWSRRRDFELVVTSDAVRDPRSFERFVGWQSQTELPNWYARTDVTIVPTIAQDGLPRTAVEAMASGRPVIGSRVGGVPFAVKDEVTGLLVEPGDPRDLSGAIARLLDDTALRARLGRAGRREFLQRFTWERVVADAYVPLLGAPVRRVEEGATS